MIDTHCHLTFSEYAGRIDQVLADAASAGVTGAITISTTTQDCLSALAIAEKFENVWCSAGVHPLYADRGPHVWDNLRTVASHPKCVAWGELGLDNHYDKPIADVQRQTLHEQLAFIESCRSGAEAIDLPIVVHCREAYDDLLPILRESSTPADRHVFHCFTGNADEARRVLDFGALISFTGVVTFGNAPEVREAAKLVPMDRMMVETDSPFLTPAPHRKIRPNEPKYAMDTARFLADLRGAAWDAFHAQINENSQRFYGVPC